MNLVVEEIEERHLGIVSESIIYALVGKTSKQLLGIIIKPTSSDKKRMISFSDIDRMVQILEDMSIK
jgi:hypothetical protein